MIELKLANAKAVKYACMKYHYAQRIPIANVAFNVYEDNIWCGVIIYGFGANKSIASSFGKWEGQVLELVRVALNGKQTTTSQCVALSLKLLKKYAPCVDLIVSYADADQNHKGIIYQATNWIYAGLVNEKTKGNFIIYGKKMHPKSVHSKNWKQSLDWIQQNVDKFATQEVSRGKHKYLFPLNEKTKKEILRLSKPYPS
jgi:hypothetical protein